MLKNDGDAILKELYSDNSPLSNNGKLGIIKIIIFKRFFTKLLNGSLL
jgi:hypothetical protein